MSRILRLSSGWLIFVTCFAFLVFPVEWGRGSARGGPIYLPMVVRTYSLKPHIAFISERDSNREIYTVGTDGSELVRITNNTAMDFSHQWSPDGAKIAYTCSFSLCTMNPDGSAKKTLAFDVDQYPDWSPDGQQIVFSHTLNGSTDIYLIGVDGTGLTRLTFDPAVDYRPV